MILIEKEKKFQLNIKGYECSDSTSYHDVNWLSVAINVTDGALSWEAEDNCLLTYELVRLKDWFENLLTSSNDEITFTENELAFRFDKNKSILYVVLDFHLHPKGESYEYGEGGDYEYLLGFFIDESKKNALVAALDKVIRDFPVIQID